MTAAPPLFRSERPHDADAIADVITAAFAASAHGDHGEAALVARLRDAGALTVALVAEQAGAIVGHIAFSPVTISDGSAAWFGLAPVAVLPAWQGRGIGDQLVRTGLAQLRAGGAAGCVVLGNPAYYGRFGFAADPALHFARLPPGPFQRLCFWDDVPAGSVSYHPAFA